MAGLILGIETSCDETAAAVVAGGRQILSNVISSQIELHRPFGGVVPELASRNHLENISLIIEEALAAAGITWEDLDGIAVTYGPGLVGALLVGVTVAKAIAFARRIPWWASTIWRDISFPISWPTPAGTALVALVVSGGHTDLLQVLDYGQYRPLGQTRDDAAGDAFDKVAGPGPGLSGGPQIDAVAREGTRGHFLPRAVIKDAP